MFFIIGCQRSGTTLARLILESHSQITCIDEPYCYEELLKPIEKISNNFYGFKTPLLTEQFNKRFFSDVTLNFIIPNKFKNFSRIFMIRDVRDTLASMQNLKQGNQNWYEMWPKQHLDFWKYTIPNFEKTFKDDLLKISNSTEKLASIASFYWKYKNLPCLEYENNNSTCKIKYEDMVNEPKLTIKKIIDFLKLSWEDELLLHHKKEHNFTNEEGITVGNTDTKSPINNSSVGNYKKKFTPKQLDAILDISGELMLKLGYTI